MVMLLVVIKLRLDFNQLPLKMQKRSFRVLLINKTRLNSTTNSTTLEQFGRRIVCKTYIFINSNLLSYKTENRTKKSRAQLSD